MTSVDNKSRSLVGEILHSPAGDLVKTISAYSMQPLIASAIEAETQCYIQEAKQASASTKMQESALDSMINLQPKRDSVESQKLECDALEQKLRLRKLAAEYFGVTPSTVSQSQLQEFKSLQ